MKKKQNLINKSPSDPSSWVDLHGDYLYGYALLRLRDQSAAEDAVQETLLAAIQNRSKFEGRASERTWLTGILKHKIIDQFRRAGKESTVDDIEGAEFEHSDFFRDTGEWKNHWKPEKAPVEWRATPAELVEQEEFWNIFVRCLSPLPKRIASAFTLREIDEMPSEEICKVLGISATNLWVMLHRARLHLRNCLQINWFRRAA
ncbi:MAG TPA: sigma-70 family RNA polymerase sigma factor [Blastocatellia bacterium]|nr:sigma-70 family RNA polymerase sigma factor [Blastocatellia bacterium]